MIGDGAMGTICAIMLAENGHKVRLWSAFADAAEELTRTRENRRFLPGPKLPENIEVTADDSLALEGAELVFSAVPTQFIRNVWQRLAGYCPKGLPICSVAKGVENGTLLRPSEVLLEVLDGSSKSDRPIAVLSGPSIAPEIADKLPATVAIAATSSELAQQVQEAISRPYFRAYTNPDLVGVELAGATKNVIAIAAGILDGMGCGDNAKAALLARGLAEITRLGLAMEARSETFAGLAGVGDLVTTCISPVGRNRCFGQAIGQGKTVQEALSATNSVVEGVATTRSVVELARKLRVEMPITEAIHEVLFDQKSPTEAVEALMNRPLRSETDSDPQ